MARISAPVGDFSGVVANVTFVDGAGETSDPGALNYFRRHGYAIANGDEPSDNGPEGDDLSSRTVDALKAYAVEYDIDLGDAKKKPDIVAAIRAHFA